MTAQEIKEKFDLDVLEVHENGVYLHMGRDLTLEEWAELNREIQSLIESEGEWP